VKLEVRLDREDGPLHGSRLAYNYRFPDPEREILEAAERPPPAFGGPADIYQWQKDQERAKFVIENLARAIAQSLTEALANKE
jgi:hypothetical protein